MPILSLRLLFSPGLVFGRIILAEGGWWRVRLEQEEQSWTCDNVVDNFWKDCPSHALSFSLIIASDTSSRILQQLCFPHVRGEGLSASTLLMFTGLQTLPEIYCFELREAEAKHFQKQVTFIAVTREIAHGPPACCQGPWNSPEADFPVIAQFLLSFHACIHSVYLFFLPKMT